MKRALKILSLVFVASILTSIPDTYAQVANYVPDYYYANYQFSKDWDAISDWFTIARAKYSINQEPTSEEFMELYNHFKKVFPNLTQDYNSVYEKCLLLASTLANEYSYSNMEALMWNSCYKSLNQAINKINSSYTVKPQVKSNPGGWMAPLTVTFDARNSSDPSMETIPEKNFYRYYRDEKWVDRPIWEWQVLSYTFEEAGKFIVHLVVRSSNADKWILDWERNLTISVTPKAADIVVYANTRRMSSVEPLKIWISEWEKWVVFDGSLTMPRWWRKILKHRWTITNSDSSFSYDSKYLAWSPSYINVPLKWNWSFKVTLTTIDNENNKVSANFYIYMSEPVTVIKQTPENWTTSTTFNFDGRASYSITNRLNTYVWEVFDGNWDEGNWNKIDMKQGKTYSINFWDRGFKPGNYMVRLTVTDMAGNQNVETKNIYVESSKPSPQFTVTATSKWEKPSEFTLDASNTVDVDVNNNKDSLEYKWSFSPNDVETGVVEEYGNDKIIVRFNEKWKHVIRLTVTDQYWKTASVSKTVDIKSTLRPGIQALPWPITWGELMEFKSTVNREVWDYNRNFWDGTPSISSEKAKETEHRYWHRWIFSVKLRVEDKDWDNNTVVEKVFIWETDYPIAAYRVSDNKWYYVQSSDTCRIENELWNYDSEEAYSVDRYSKFRINPSISVNTKWTSQWLKYVFEKESIAWTNQAKVTNQLNESFSEIGCHYVDLTVQDTNLWKQDKVRIRFNVKNAQPTIKNVTLSFPQYENSNTNSIRFTNDTNSNKSIFECSWTSNLTIKVTAVDPKDSDWNISRLRFYYYNIEDPERILEYKDTWISVPYVYFVIPKIAWEYKFWVMVYDNDWWMIDSEEYLASNPSVYFPAICGDADVPMVVLKVDHTNIQVWDEVTYSISSKISTDNEDFATDRTFYYDFTWDWSWDLVTKKDTATYTFQDAYEDWVTPRAAVEYRWKLWKAEWTKITVKNGIKPILLFNSYGNTVIFRDLSIWTMQQREICFENKECEAWNTKFKKTHISTVDANQLTWWTETPITKNDSFIWNYDNEWTHNVSIYFKNKYGIEAKKTYEVKTPLNKNNGKIAPWVNMITIPETTFTNSTPEIFLNKTMNNTLIMYINNDSWETCYVDTDIATDSDWDYKTDNDMDIMCNKMAKIKYEPEYENTIWRLYFTNNGNLTFKNFYVTFEWKVLELDDEKREIYNDITTLMNWIEDISIENTNLKKTLDKLRKNLNNRSETTSLVLTIKDQISNWWITMDLKQKESLDFILSRLENEDTVILVWMSEYERNKQEIFTIIPSDQTSIRATAEWMFESFEENAYSYTLDEKAKELWAIRDTIISDGKKNKWMYNESDFTPYFCSIFDYYNISTYNKKCWAGIQNITDNYDKSKWDTKSWWSWFPMWLKIILIILVWWLLTMWWIIIFFSIKAKLNSKSENDEDEW